MGHHKLKTVQKHLCERRTWCRIIFLEKSSFCPYRTLLTHLGTHLFGLELAACRSLLGLRMGV